MLIRQLNLYGPSTAEPLDTITGTSASLKKETGYTRLLKSVAIVHLRQTVDEKNLLERLAQIGAFEVFLHRVYPGKTRFSIEGLDRPTPNVNPNDSNSAAHERSRRCLNRHGTPRSIERSCACTPKTIQSNTSRVY